MSTPGRPYLGFWPKLHLHLRPERHRNHPGSSSGLCSRSHSAWPQLPQERAGWAAGRGPRWGRALLGPGSATAGGLPPPQGLLVVRVQRAPCRPGLPGANKPGDHPSGALRTEQAVPCGLRLPHSLLGTAPEATCLFPLSIYLFVLPRFTEHLLCAST